VPDAVLVRVGDGIHGAAQTEARGGDGGGGAETRNCVAWTEARGGDGGGGAEMRDQAEHVIAVMGELLEQCSRMKARGDPRGTSVGT